tara:strand:- start:24953 stop:25414 length:462 start_codon:yes stop_codon:yes gene_type:complete
MKNFIQPGETLDLLAPSGGVTSGLGYLIGALFVVAAVTAAEGETFAGARTGVFDLDATTHASTQAFAAGDPVYWNDTTKKVTATATGNQIIGFAVEAKESTAATAKVLLVQRRSVAGTTIADVPTAGSATAALNAAAINTILASLEAAGINVA